MSITEVLGFSTWGGGYASDCPDNHWNDDDSKFSLEFNLWPKNDYPWEPYVTNGNIFRMRGIGNSAKEAYENAVKSVKKAIEDTLVPLFKRDKMLASKVGKIVRAINKDIFFDHAKWDAIIATNPEGTTNEIKSKCRTTIDVDMGGEVIKHEPGRLRLKIGPNFFWAHDYKFNGKNPYYEFVN